MIINTYFEEILNAGRRYREDCGDSGCGGAEAPRSDCGGSGCGFRESVHRMNECGVGGVSISYSSCGGSGYSSSGCGGWSSRSSSCEIGRRVRIAVGSGCGASVEVGRLLGYAD